MKVLKIIFLSVITIASTASFAQIRLYYRINPKSIGLTPGPVTTAYNCGSTICVCPTNTVVFTTNSFNSPIFLTSPADVINLPDISTTSVTLSKSGQTKCWGPATVQNVVNATVSSFTAPNFNFTQAGSGGAPFSLELTSVNAPTQFEYDGSVFNQTECFATTIGSTYFYICHYDPASSSGRQ